MLRIIRSKWVFRLIWILFLPLSLASAVAASITIERVLYLPFVAMHLPTQTPRVYNFPFISEVLYDPVGDEPSGEWIELYNPGETKFDLSQFKLGDAETPGDREGMLRFPQGASMASHAVVIIANRASSFEAAYGFKPDYEMAPSDPVVPDMLKHYAWSGYSLELTDSGDEVLLLNIKDQIVEALSWGSSTFAFDPAIAKVPQGCSLERVPANLDQDSAQDWTKQCSPAPGQVDLHPATPTPTLTPMPTSTITPMPTDTAAPCGEAPVLISEFLYDPAGDFDPGGEWIEVYNPSDKHINLACLRIGDEETMGGGEGMLRFPPEAWLSPQGVKLIANQGKMFFETYGIKPDFEIVETDPTIEDMIKFPDWATGSVNLSAAGDEVLIWDVNEHLVDAVSWGASVFAFDPSVPAVLPGHSIERQPANRDTDLASDWKDQANPDPGFVDFSTPTPTPLATFTRTPTVTITPTVTPMACTHMLLLISEVLYDPLGDTDTGREWIEIYNSGDQGVNLSCARIGDEETKGGGEAMLIFPDNGVIEPGQVVVVANRATIFRETYSFDPDYEIIGSDTSVPDMLRFSSWGTGSLNLSNSGDEVLLLDWLDRLVDAVSWGSSTFAFDPSIALVAEGHSLERIPADVDTNRASDWYDRGMPQPGVVEFATQRPSVTTTPTRTNSPTPNKTNTPAPTLTPTLKPTKTSTPTVIPSPSRTPTLAFTVTPSPTANLSPTPSPTFTNIPDPTGTATSKPAPTTTQAPTATPSPTYTVSVAPSPTTTAEKVMLLISEVFHNEVDQEPHPDIEWVELYNPISSSIDLSNYKLGDEETPGRSEGMMRFPAGAWITSGQVIVIAYRADFFYDLHRFLPDYEFSDSMPEVPTMIPYLSWSSGTVILEDWGDEVLLLDGDDRVADVVAYGDSLYPDFQPAVSVEEGSSIERCPADRDTDSSSDWIIQSSPNPGVVNSAIQSVEESWDRMPLLTNARRSPP